MSATALLPIETVQDILSYLGKEFYQDNDKTLQIRFLPGIFDNALGYLFKKVFTRMVREVPEIIYDYEAHTVKIERIRFFSLKIRRRHSRCQVDYHTCNDREMLDSIEYFFGCTDPAQTTNYQFGKSRYRFFRKAD